MCGGCPNFPDEATTRSPHSPFRSPADLLLVRHCYFTGGADPYKRLRQALKSDIDEDAWAAVYRTSSLPFAKPTTGKIAVKVINDYGDPVVKVLEV